MKRKTKRQLFSTIQTLTLIILFLAVLTLIPVWFQSIDCNTARKGLAAIQACEDDPNCYLSRRDSNLRNVYVRLEAKSCYVDNG